MASLCHVDKKLAQEARVNLYLPAHFNPDDLISQKRYN